MKRILEHDTVDFSNTEIAFANKSDRELLKTSRLFKLMNNPGLVKLTSRLGLWAVKWGLPFSNKIVKETIFFQFCGGKSLMESQAAIDRLQRNKTLAVLDYGAEGKSDEADLDRTLDELMHAVRFAASNPNIPIVSTKLTSLATNEILERWQQDKPLSETEQAEFDQFLNRVDTLCKEAFEQGVAVFVDAEESWMQVTIDHVVEIMMQRYNLERAVVYNTYQLYRHDKLAQLKSDHAKAVKNGYLFGAKLVRGAYMGKERRRAAEMGYPSPIQKDKESTDKDYNAAVRYCVENYKTIASCNATHNLESNLLQANLIAEMDLPRSHPHLNFCQLFGMSDNITFNLADADFNVAKYVVYGPIKEVIPYLVRRAEENTSVTGDMSRELKLISKEVKRRGL